MVVVPVTPKPPLTENRFAGTVSLARSLLSTGRTPLSREFGKLPILIEVASKPNVCLLSESERDSGAAAQAKRIAEAKRACMGAIIRLKRSGNRAALKAISANLQGEGAKLERELKNELVDLSNTADKARNQVLGGRSGCPDITAIGAYNVKILQLDAELSIVRELIAETNKALFQPTA